MLAACQLIVDEARPQTVSLRLVSAAPGPAWCALHAAVGSIGASVDAAFVDEEPLAWTVRALLGERGR